MATISIPASLDSAPLLLAPATDMHTRFSRAAYHRMVDAGVLHSDSRVELIDGEIFTMLPIGPPQGSLISRLSNFFGRCLPESLDCRVQLPVAVDDHSEPEPDIAIVRRRDDDYQHEHPSPNDVLLLIEVAQSSLEFDLGRKLRLYAVSGISEYWVVNVERKTVLIHQHPSGLQYQSVGQAATNGVIAPVAVPDCRLDLRWLFR